MDTESINAELTDIRKAVARIANAAIDEHDPGLFLLLGRLTREIGNIREYMKTGRTGIPAVSVLTRVETMEEMGHRHRQEWWAAFSVEPPAIPEPR